MKQLKNQETTGKTSKKKNSRVEQEVKEKLDRSASNARRRCPSGTPGDATDAPTEQFQQKDKNMSFYVNKCAAKTPYCVGRVL